MAYTPTGTFIPCKTNGLITEKYSKSYSFSIVKPTTYPGEESVNGVIWVLDIEAMGKSTDPNERQRATWAAGRDYSDRDNPVDYPLAGNYYIVGNLYSFPTVNPRNKIPIDENNYNIKKRDDIKYLEFITEKLFRVKETKELNSNSTVDDLIDLALKYLKSDYINTIYGRFGDPVWRDAYNKKKAGEITQEKLDQIYYSLGDLPEYKISLKIDESGVKPITPVEQTPPSNNETLAKVESPTAVAEVQYKFNVEKTDTFIVVGGTVSPPLEFIIVPNDGTEYVMDVFNDIDDLGDEYKEGQYEGTEEDLFKIQPGEPYPIADLESLNSLKGFDPNNPNESLSTDSTSKYPISKDKDANAKAIISAAKSLGVTNKFAIAGILAIVSKESGFVPRSEASYAGTSGARIIKIFGSRGYSADQWDVIKKNPEQFFNIVYGNKYGNGSSDGYKYRGRGFNQITFKGNYEQYAKDTGLNLVNDPDLLNTVDAAAKCLIAFFKRGIKNAGSDKRSLYHFTDINSFKNLDDATGAMYHANAGWGKKYSEVIADSTGGRKKAFANAGPLFNTYQSQIA
jgi:putative chitinase